MYSNQLYAKRQRERGAVLIVAMIFLIIMTLLAVTGMTTTSLEEKMASNSQESTRAFQAAETGLAKALDDHLNTFDLSGTFSEPSAPMFTDSDLEIDYHTDRLADGGIPLELNNTEYATEVDCFNTANFDLISTGSTAAGITVTIHGGAWQIKKLIC